MLNLGQDFPPTPTAEWEAAIHRKDLKGADYEKKLVWRTEEGLAMRPYYRREELRWAKPRPCAAMACVWEAAQEPEIGGRAPFAPTNCTKRAPTRSRNWDTRWRRRWSGWRSGGHAAGG